MENLLTDNCMKLGFGMMRLPRTEGTKEIDLEQTKQMVDEFIEAGGKYFDTAFIYEGSEAATKAALCVESGLGNQCLSLAVDIAKPKKNIM